MSMRISIPYPFRKPTNFSAEWLEWPMVNTLFFTAPLSPMAQSFPGNVTDEG